MGHYLLLLSMHGNALLGVVKKIQFVLDFIQWSTPGRMDAWNKAASTVLYCTPIRL